MHERLYYSTKVTLEHCCFPSCSLLPVVLQPVCRRSPRPNRLRDGQCDYLVLTTAVMFDSISGITDRRAQKSFNCNQSRCVGPHDSDRTINQMKETGRQLPSALPHALHYHRVSLFQFIFFSRKRKQNSLGPFLYRDLVRNI